MAIKFITIKCPSCGADQQLENNRDSAYCTYCGAKIMIANDNEHILRTIDEARIKQAETERIIRLKELEIQEKTNFPKKILIAVWLLACIVLLITGIVGFATENEGLGGVSLLILFNVAGWGALGLFSGDSKKKKQHKAGENEVKITTAMMDCVDYHYNKAVILYKNAGFTNINAIPLHDLTRFNLKKEGMVESITINGEVDFEEDEIYPKNANILITYHSK